jgi:hypothetical protein
VALTRPSADSIGERGSKNSDGDEGGAKQYVGKTGHEPDVMRDTRQG